MERVRAPTEKFFHLRYTAAFSAHGAKAIPEGTRALKNLTVVEFYPYEKCRYATMGRKVTKTKRGALDAFFLGETRSLKSE